MRVAIFFMCLCALVLKGDAYRAHHHTPGYALMQHIGKMYTENRIHPATPQIADNDAATDRDALIGSDAEEEDSSNFFARKCRLSARHLAVQYGPICSSYSSHLSYHCNYLKAPPSALGQVSYKYILQGVLRI